MGDIISRSQHVDFIIMHSFTDACFITWRRQGRVSAICRGRILIAVSSE